MKIVCFKVIHFSNFILLGFTSFEQIIQFRNICQVKSL